MARCMLIIMSEKAYPGLGHASTYSNRQNRDTIKFKNGMIQITVQIEV